MVKYTQMFAKLGLTRLRYLGEKAASWASRIGNKVGHALISASPVLTAINPALGSLAVGAGGVASGIGALGDLGQRALARGVNVDSVSEARGTLKNIRDGAMAIKQSYSQLRGQGSGLERSR